jgi:hypothetical protein
MFLRRAVFGKHFFHQVRIDVATLKRARIQTVGGEETLWIGLDGLADSLLNAPAIRLREFASDDWFDVWHPGLRGYFLRGTNLAFAELAQLGERIDNSAHCLRDRACANDAAFVPHQSARLRFGIKTVSPQQSIAAVALALQVAFEIQRKQPTDGLHVTERFV